MADGSGPRKGIRRFLRGCADARALVYLSALVATHNNEVIKDFDNRVIAAAGERNKFGRMRKPLMRLNAMLRDQ